MENNYKGNEKNWRFVMPFIWEIKYEHILMILKLITKIDQTQKKKKKKTNLTVSMSIKMTLTAIAKLFYKNKKYLLISKIIDK